jgi:hypothetical protein
MDNERFKKSFIIKLTRYRYNSSSSVNEPASCDISWFIQCISNQQTKTVHTNYIVPIGTSMEKNEILKAAWSIHKEDIMQWASSVYNVPTIIGKSYIPPLDT